MQCIGGKQIHKTYQRDASFEITYEDPEEWTDSS